MGMGAGEEIRFFGVGQERKIFFVQKLLYRAMRKLSGVKPLSPPIRRCGHYLKHALNTHQRNTNKLIDFTQVL